MSFVVFMTNQQLKDSFRKLSFDDKKKKMLFLLDMLKDKNQIFSKLIYAINHNSKTNENILIELYSDLLNFSDYVEKDKNKKVEDSFLHIKDVLQKIHKIEELDKDIDLDVLLNQI